MPIWAWSLNSTGIVKNTVFKTHPYSHTKRETDQLLRNLLIFKYLICARHYSKMFLWINTINHPFERKLLFFFQVFSFFFPSPQHEVVPGPGIKPLPQQWQRWILNPLSHHGNPERCLLLLILFHRWEKIRKNKVKKIFSPCQPGIKPIYHSSDPSCCRDNVGSLTHWATRKLPEIVLSK